MSTLPFSPLTHRELNARYDAALNTIGVRVCLAAADPSMRDDLLSAGLDLAAEANDLQAAALIRTRVSATGERIGA